MSEYDKFVKGYMKIMYKSIFGWRRFFMLGYWGIVPCRFKRSFGRKSDV